LYTSGIKQRKMMVRIGFGYLFIALFCILFGAVYELFSHGVYSYFMIYAFVFPLAGGVFPFFKMAFGRYPLPNKLTRNLYHSGIATLTTGFLFKGALEIYGTTNRLVLVYWIVGILFILMAIFIYCLFLRKTKYRKMENDDLDL
jgi:hypothetical protein